MKNIIKDKKIIISLIIILILILLFFFMFKREKNENNNILDNNVKKVTNNNFFINLDDFVKNIKKEYKEKESFQNCLAQDMGLKICLREEVNKKIKEKNNSDYCNDLVFQSDINNCLTDFKYQSIKY